MTDVTQINESSTKTLEKHQELRYEIEFDQQGWMRLVEGTAECFGTELLLNKIYKLTSTKGAVFTWTGCKIEITNNCSPYIGDKTPMQKYSAVFQEIENSRSNNFDPNQSGPRVMIVGPTDSGKSSVSKILLAYSSRLGYEPLFIDLDPGQNSVTIPGTISASHIQSPIDIEEGLSSFVPLAHFYGHASLDVNPELFKALVRNLAAFVDKQMLASETTRMSGFVVNTCGWIDGLGYKVLLDNIEAFRINMIIVMDNEKLFSDLNSHFQQQQIKILKLPKSGGVFLRTPIFRKKTRMLKIKEYFNGVNDSLSPHYIYLDFKDVSIFRTGGGPVAPASALPIGQQSSIDPLAISEVYPSIDMCHSIVAISYAKQPQHIFSTNVAGFLYINDIDMETKKITVISPAPGPIPSRYLLIGTLKWTPN
ncbi:hypothetical protein DICPUDRAFT_52854 [Dictyostelium purpureum]|uniref:Protein CLP1 homolog n=1 Tax=Dictyostelium purpureum TaxID=5786 RepID=F0ZA95_DICPU|nr:uncharacterized protein DICPUDRAFT_52854 [Dictyostelium purpureum]EGC39164.1 hypothetical protein DICPUDRAFT_52854 [Dictyostelium purpureum]|eukprot:XP_003284310.1 hypothetical protein DICPUDRAFT_52854 [Dictyostelium purpureum]